MTTITDLYVDKIYIRGQSIIDIINSGTDVIKNNISTINALLNGLFGGDVISTSPPNKPNIHEYVPMNTDDINNNWNIGSIWVTNSQAYICVDNTESNAKWKLLKFD